MDRARWKVIISYTPKHMVDEVHEIEELDILDKLIELGPDWRLLDAITITYNHAD